MVVSRWAQQTTSLEVVRRKDAGWIRDGEPLVAEYLPQPCLSACFVNGTQLLACSNIGRLFLWDLRTREVVWQLPEQDPALLPGRGPYRSWLAVAATPDAGTIWVGGTPGILHRFDRTGEGGYRETRQEMRMFIRSLLLLPDGSLLVGGSSGLLVRLDRDGRMVHFRGHLDRVMTLAWTRIDGELRIVSGDQAGVLRLWKEDGTPLRELPGPDAAVWSVCFSPDGTRIVSGADNGTARIWWTRAEDLLRVARA